MMHASFAAAGSVHIIGRGIAGLAAAFALQKRGCQVTVLGPKAVAGSASRAAVGSSTMKGNILAQEAFFGLKLRGHQGLRSWLESIEAASGMAIPRLMAGAYEPFCDGEHYARLRERVFHRQFTGCFGVEVRTRDELLRLFPARGAFPAAYAGALHYGRDLWFSPQACLEALEAALRRGGAVFDEAMVEAIAPRPDGGQLIVTARGVLTARQCVLAAGCFSNEILAASGFAEVRQELVEGETVLAEVPQAPPLQLKLGKMNYIVYDEVLRIGSSARLRPALASCAVSESDAASLAALGRHELGDVGSTTTLWGVRGRFKDHAPAFGTLSWAGSEQRFWLLTGFYKNGLQLAHVFAERLAEQVLAVHPLSPTLSTAFPQPLASFF